MPAPFTINQIPDLKLLICDRAGAVKAEVVNGIITDVQWQLNKEGKLDFTIPSTDPVNAKIKTVIHEAQLWWKGVPLWVGPIWQKRAKPGERTYQAQGLLSYFRKRFVLNASQLYTSIEQTTIANSLVVSAQSGHPYMDFLIPTGASVGGSTHIRSRNYERDRHECYYDLLQQFTGLRDGFDFEIVIDPSGTTRTFVCYWPQKGGSLLNYGLEWGQNIIDYEVDEDGFVLANRVYATGASANNVKFENNYESSASEAIYGQMQKIVNDSAQKDVDWLLDLAHRHVSLYEAPTISGNVTAVEVPQALIGSVFVGDSLVVNIQDLDISYGPELRRIDMIKWKPDDSKLVFEFVTPVVLT